MSPYGCYNKTRPTAETTYLGQEGYEGEVHMGWDTYARERVYKPIKHVMSTECKYTLTHAADKLCSGCVHRSKEPS
jgi:hypothetical protein